MNPPPAIPSVIANNEIDPLAEKLKGASLKEAAKDLCKPQYKNYVKVQRSRDDPPLENQVYSLHTFVPSPGAKPDSEGCFGMIKFRGAFLTEENAMSRVMYILKNVDSKHDILLGYVGKECPLTDESLWCREVTDIQTWTSKIADERSKQEKEKDKKVMEEIEEHRQKLLEDVKKDPTARDLDYYATLRVKVGNLRQIVDEYETKLVDVKEIIEKARQEVVEIHKTNPEFQDQFLDKYKKSMGEVGLNEANTKIFQYLEWKE